MAGQWGVASLAAMVRVAAVKVYTLSRSFKVFG